MSRIVFTPGLGVLVPDHEADRDLERHGERHAALLALLDVVLELHLHGRAAEIADVAARLVGAAARRADHGAFAVRIGDEHRAAALALLAQVLEAGQPAALALPVADRILDELERRVLAEVADRKHRLEHRLQADVFALGRQAVHLQKPFVRFLLNLDQVRDRDRRLDLRKVDALAVDVLGQAVHSITLWNAANVERRTANSSDERLALAIDPSKRWHRQRSSVESEVRVRSQLPTPRAATADD